MAAPRVLIFTASIGEGHDLPARVLADAIAAERPGSVVAIADTLAAIRPGVRRMVMDGSNFETDWGNRIFDLEFRLLSRFPPTRLLSSALIELLAASSLGRVVESFDPDVVVSTYPGSTEALARLRAKGALEIPLVSAITDLAALRFWAHRSVDLHLVIHPESIPEVNAIAPGSRVECVRGLTDEAFYDPPDRDTARRELGLPVDGPVVVVSGGGWGVGDLAGAIEEGLAVEGATVLCLAGRNEGVRSTLEAGFAGSGRVVVMGFTDRMPTVLAAGDVLVHSTAGLTVYEALMLGCRVVSYGWGRAHIRLNNEAYIRDGLAEVAADRSELRAAISRALAEPSAAEPWFASLPTAASRVLDLADASIP